MLPNYSWEGTIFIVLWICINSFKFPSSPKVCICIFFSLKCSRIVTQNIQHHLNLWLHNYFKYLSQCTIPVCGNRWLFLARQTRKYFDSLSRKGENYFFLNSILVQKVFLPPTKVKVVFLLNSRIFQVFWVSLCTILYVCLIEATVLMKQTSENYLTSYRTVFSFKHITRILPTRKKEILGHGHISSNSPKWGSEIVWTHTA